MASEKAIATLAIVSAIVLMGGSAYSLSCSIDSNSETVELEPLSVTIDGEAQTLPPHEEGSIVLSGEFTEVEPEGRVDFVAFSGNDVVVEASFVRETP